MSQDTYQSVISPSFLVVFFSVFLRMPASFLPVSGHYYGNGVFLNEFVSFFPLFIVVDLQISLSELQI